MKSQSAIPAPVIFFLAARPKFLFASAAPILVGSSLAWASSAAFNPYLFVLALLTIITIHAGANVANDYFDHLSGADQLNKKPTPFSGGSRFIQKGILSPRATIVLALTYLAIGASLGLVIVALTKSLFVLTLGLLGILGGFFYTAPPLRLGYRGLGEFVIAALFGVLPVYGSYYLQTQTIDAAPLLPACIVSILIFLVILVNEIPDVGPDAAANKNTLVVHFGIPAAIKTYRVCLVSCFFLAAFMLAFRPCTFAALFFLPTLSIGALAIKSLNKKDLSLAGMSSVSLAKEDTYRASQLTILLHALGCIALTAGFVVFTLTKN
jgi:1,4-dihydroxy-2-naphthoate octaprenyltransferase